MVSTVVDIIRTQADLDTPALVFEDREISYRTLHARSSQVAQAIRGAGVTAGTASHSSTRTALSTSSCSSAQPSSTPSASCELATRTARDRTRDHRRSRGGPVRRRRPRRPHRADRGRPAAAIRIVALDGHARWDTTNRGSVRSRPTILASSHERRHSPCSSTRRAPPACPKGVMLSNRNFFAMVGEAAADVGVPHRDGQHRRDAALPHRRHRVEPDGDGLRRPPSCCTGRSTREAILATSGARGHPRDPRAGDPSADPASCTRATADFRRRSRPSSTAHPRSATRCCSNCSTRSTASSCRCTGSPRRAARSRTLDAEDHDPARPPELLRSCGQPLDGVELRIVDRRDRASTRAGRGRRGVDPQRSR